MAACPSGEVYVPATGPAGFTMGRGRLRYGFGKMGQRPGGTEASDAPHVVVLTNPFCMDQTEVTVRAMKQCVDAERCRAPTAPNPYKTYPSQLDHPVNQVTWTMAKAFCAWQGKSLPTEAQWEWAATGGESIDYPWGNAAPTCEHADFTNEPISHPAGDFGCHGGGPSPVGTHPRGDRSWPSGRIHDLAGNVWEWVEDSYLPFATSTVTDPIVTRATGMHVVRGGGWNRSAAGIRAWFRGGAVTEYAVPGLGFRCVRNPRP